MKKAERNENLPKNISLYVKPSGITYYRVCIIRIGFEINKYFRTLEEAVAFKAHVLKTLELRGQGKGKFRLSYQERLIIENGLKEGLNFARIAKKLNRSLTTVLRETKKVVPYNAKEAHKLATNSDFAMELLEHESSDIAAPNIPVETQESPSVSNEKIDKILSKLEVLEMHLEILIDFITKQ